MLGIPALTVRATVSGTDAELDARLWDLPLSGNAWRFRPGHTVELELLQNDAGYLRADNLPPRS
jgi:hypothetical protein